LAHPCRSLRNKGTEMAKQTVVVDLVLLGKMAGYIEMLVKDPYSTIFAALSDIYRTFGLHEEAVAVAQRGSKMVPTYAPGFVSLGRALAEREEPTAASDAYRKALAIDPVNLEALTGLASVCLACGQSDEALALLSQAQTIDPDDEVVKQLLTLTRKLSAIPSPPPIAQDVIVPQPPREVLTEVAKEKADQVVLPEGLPPIATATLADIYIKQGFPERALKVFTDLLLEEPGNIEIRQRYNDLYEKINSPPAEAAVVSSLENESNLKSVSLPKVTGKEALVALYGRWLDAVNRRRADVH